MRRTLTALAVTPLMLLALAGQATAAKPDVTRTSESATSVAAGSEFEMGKVFVNAVLTRTGSALQLAYGTADGVGGGVETTVEADHGFTLTIGKGRLASATLLAEDLPASTCTYEGEQQIGCVDTTVDVSLTWTGFGPVSRGGSTSREKGDGYMIISHGTGSTRSATVSGSISGSGWSVSSFDWGELSNYKNFDINRCTGDACLPPEE